jgi:hypothetical protein
MGKKLRFYFFEKWIITEASTTQMGEKLRIVSSEWLASKAAIAQMGKELRIVSCEWLTGKAATTQMGEDEMVMVPCSE